ncbi:uncharacterized protein Z520_04597 [Fonsecaea multimorphosa CBS 102226]|uniref:Extracellular membrane protein CFEM domain-containing protein n=1 Tax=Fonsecaea multimorphosa CBS 102226 TaxID=1442371 RepID=A0A0D2K9Z7_9EURO|nr:uncharacterized protein Z520_04597 [Fonsecaea multimorphosa CBS 102226]KIX99959.1 hypothetical protein Z520_04597 [Fonsecaea multimorphosa CBS 102226]
MAQHLLVLAFGVSAVLAQSTSLDYCQALVDVMSLCQAETSGFTLLPATSQASCLCSSQISTLTWGPQEFDDLASLCASQYATVDTDIASDASALEGFCTMFGADAQVTSSSPSSASATTSATPGNIIQGTLLTDSGFSTEAGTTATPAAETPSTTPAPSVSYSVVTVGSATPSANPNSNPAARVDGNEQLTGGLLFGLLSYLGYLLV